MIKGTQVINLPVLTKKKGNKIGEVKEIIYSKKKFRVTAMLIDEGGFFKEAKVITFKNIEAIGNDAVIIKNEMDIDNVRSLPEVYKIIEDKNKFLGSEIITDTGDSLGFIQDFVIDNGNGRILAFILTDGIIQDIMDGRNILPYIQGIKFGEDAIIIDSKIKEDFYKNKNEYKKLLELE